MTTGSTITQIANIMVKIIAPSNIKFQGATTQHSRGIKIVHAKGIKHKSINLFVGNVK